MIEDHMYRNKKLGHIILFKGPGAIFLVDADDKQPEKLDHLDFKNLYILSVRSEEEWEDLGSLVDIMYNIAVDMHEGWIYNTGYSTYPPSIESTDKIEVSLRAASGFIKTGYPEDFDWTLSGDIIKYRKIS